MERLEQKFGVGVGQFWVTVRERLLIVSTYCFHPLYPYTYAKPGLHNSIMELCMQLFFLCVVLTFAFNCPTKNKPRSLSRMTLD